jgi:hypothetical protein
MENEREGVYFRTGERYKKPVLGVDINGLKTEGGAAGRWSEFPTDGRGESKTTEGEGR